MMQMMSDNEDFSVGGFAPEQTSQYLSNPKPNIIPDSLPKKKRNLPGKPDPDAEVIALSPKSLMATNRFICEICNKGFQRDQNLQLHRRGHNLPWKLRQRTNKEVKKKVYICPEKTCVHHDPSRALGDLTGIKKHFSRKHGEKKWKCEKCSKKYAVQSDWKAHSKTCGTREYKCDCGTLFSRKDSFITHRAFCDALAEESVRLISSSITAANSKPNSTVNAMNETKTTLKKNIHSHHFSLIPNNTLYHSQGIPQLSHGIFDLQSDHNFDHNIPSKSTSQTLPSNHLQINPHFNLLLPHDPVATSSFPFTTQMGSSNPFETSNRIPGFDKKDSKRSLNEKVGGGGGGSNSLSSIFEKPVMSMSMSATALLLKAAQLGSTRSNPSFSANSVGVMSSSSSSSSSSTHQSGSELHRLFESRKQSEAFLLHGKLDEGCNGSDLTRDFLGRRGREGINMHGAPMEMTKFASSSMSMDMELNRFIGH